MPLRECTEDGQPGVKWGEAGTCYTYQPGDEQSKDEATKKAMAQAVAMGEFEENSKELGDALVSFQDGEMDTTQDTNTEQRDVGLDLPDFIMNAAKRGLEYHSDGLSGDGITDQTLAEARAMAAGDITENKVIRASAWAARHMVDLDAPQNSDSDHPDYPGAGAVAFFLWGINPLSPSSAVGWFDRKAEAIKREEEEDDDDMEENNIDSDELDGAFAALREVAPTSRFELRRSGAGAHYRTLVGYAAVFAPSMSEDLGGFREMIEPGAFRSALERNDDVRLLFDHDSASVLARQKNGTLELREDDHGLRVWARIDMRDPDAARVAAKLANGTVDQMSFAFTVERDSFTDGEDMPTRIIHSVDDLFEVSVVSMPAYQDTKSAILEEARKQGRLQNDDGASAVAPQEGSTEPQETLGRDVRTAAAKWRSKLERKKKEISHNG